MASAHAIFWGYRCDADGPAIDGVDAVFCANDPATTRGQCSDGVAEAGFTSTLGGPCGTDPATSNCSTLVASVSAQAKTAIALVPKSNLGGALDPGTIIEGTEITMDAGGTDVLFEIVTTNWNGEGTDTPIKAYQVTLDAAGYTSGPGGTITPAHVSCS